MNEEAFELLMDYIDERINKMTDESGGDFRDWEIRSELKEKLVGCDFGNNEYCIEQAYGVLGQD